MFHCDEAIRNLNLKIMTIGTIISSFPVQLILLFNRDVLMIRYLINPNENLPFDILLC